MSNIDRTSQYDAMNAISLFIQEPDTLLGIAKFMVSKIDLANKIDASNWNLNLDKNGKFLRFNIGQLYCIELRPNELLVLCLRDGVSEKIKMAAKDTENHIRFRGYKVKRTPVESQSFDETPDCLSKLPGSIGIVFRKNIVHWLSELDEGCSSFIRSGIRNTSILPQMKSAHSVGAIFCLSKVTGKIIYNPDYVASMLMEENLNFVRASSSMSRDEVLKLAAEQGGIPEQVCSTSIVFLRNKYVASAAKL